MATDYSDLIPAGAAREMVAAIRTQSVVLRLANVMPVPMGETRVPVVSFEPEAKFVAVGGRKPASKIEWTAETLFAEEIATTLAIPDSYLDDAGYPVWEGVRERAASAIALTLDAAVLFGTDAPASYPTGGVAAIAGPAATGATALDAIDAALAAVEATGVEPDGIASSSSINSVLRAAYRAAQALPGLAPEPSLYGLRLATTPAWDDSDGDAIVGDWSKLLVGMRADIRYDLSTDGVLLDDAGEIVVSAFQDDVTLMRAYMRVGVAIGTPVGAAGTPVAPFKLVEFTPVEPPGAPAAATSSKAKK